MEGLQEEPDISPTWLFALAIAIFDLLYMLVNTCCFLKTSCREANNCCYGANQIIHSIVFLGLSFALLALTSIDYSVLWPKYQTLKEWSEFDSCVDSYMQLS